MPKYWESLELYYDPFDSTHQPEPCFLSEQWLYLLDLITQLSCYSHAILLVLARSGGGKSTLAKAFVGKLGARGICQIQGDQSVTIDFLRYLLAKHLGLSYLESQPDLFNRQLAQKLDSMAKNRQQFYLVIDDAHAMPERTLMGLLALASRQPHDFPPLHMIFFGSLPLETIVNDLIVQHNLTIVAHTSRLKPFDIETTKDYIAYCLKMAGYIHEFPLTDPEIQEIHRESEGLPGLINPAVVTCLQQKWQHSSRLSHIAWVKKWMMPTRLVGAGSLFALLLIAFVVVNHSSNVPGVISQSIDKPDFNTLLQQVESPPAYRLAGTSQQHIAADTQQNLNPTTPPNISSLTKPELQTQVAAPAEPSSVVEPTIVVTDLSDSTLPTVKSEPQEKDSSVLKSPYSADEQGLLARDPTHYTLQLLGAYHAKPLRNFIKQVELPKEIWYVHTHHHHKDWYVVIYGDYATRQEAEYAVSQLPDMVKQHQPWVRSIASIQNAITSHESVG